MVETSIKVKKYAWEKAFYSHIIVFVVCVLNIFLYSFFNSLSQDKIMYFQV